MDGCGTSGPSVVSPGPGPFVVSGSHGHGFHGFSVSDAALIRSGQDFGAQMALNTQILEAKFQTERVVRETAAQNERVTREALAEIRLAQATSIAGMQAVLAGQIQASQAASLKATDVELLIRKLLTLRPGAIAEPA